MRRLAFLLTLLAASPGLRAKEAETPFLVFREADAATEKEIRRDLITEKKLGGQVPDTRRAARARLAEIGPWSVPFLATAIRKEASARVRMNAVLALAAIRDPRGLPALREAAKEDGDLPVRRAATLAIGLFERPGDFATLRSLPRGEWRAVAPALARLRHKDAPALLKAAAERFPTKDPHDAAAIVLASAIAGPDAPAVALLEDRERLVQQAAAAGLAIRPLPPERAGEILAALHRSKLSGPARALAIRALGAITRRPPEVEKEILDIACKDGAADERIVALLELQGNADEFGPLWKAYGRDGGRNDPVAAALLLALARTGEPKAVERLLSVMRSESDFLRFYAAASLLYANGTARLDEELRTEITKVGGELTDLAQRMANQSEEVRKAALADLRHVEDPRNLRLFFDRTERNWHEVNRLLTRIFELDVVLVQFDSARPGRTQESPFGGGAGGGTEARRAPSGTDEEQDLFDLLMPPRSGAAGGNPPAPYFGPEDLGA